MRDERNTRIRGNDDSKHQKMEFSSCKHCAARGVTGSIAFSQLYWLMLFSDRQICKHSTPTNASVHCAAPTRIYNCRIGCPTNAIKNPLQSWDGGPSCCRVFVGKRLVLRGSGTVGRGRGASSVGGGTQAHCFQRPSWFLHAQLWGCWLRLRAAARTRENAQEGWPAARPNQPKTHYGRVRAWSWLCSVQECGGTSPFRSRTWARALAV